MAQGRRARHELRAGLRETLAAKTRADAEGIQRAYARYLEKGAALAAITACPSVWPGSVADVAPVVCQLLEDHPPGEDDGGHRHRILGSQTVVTW